jgi:hypothetical protein
MDLIEMEDNKIKDSDYCQVSSLCDNCGLLCVIRIHMTIEKTKEEKNRKQNMAKSSKMNRT